MQEKKEFRVDLLDRQLFVDNVLDVMNAFSEKKKVCVSLLMAYGVAENHLSWINSPKLQNMLKRQETIDIICLGITVGNMIIMKNPWFL